MPGRRDLERTLGGVLPLDVREVRLHDDLRVLEARPLDRRQRRLAGEVPQHVDQALRRECLRASHQRHFALVLLRHEERDVLLPRQHRGRHHAPHPTKAPVERQLAHEERPLAAAHAPGGAGEADRHRQIEQRPLFG